MLSYDDFKRLDLRIGKILKAERIEDSDKLLRLEVDLGSDPSTDSADSPQASSRRDTRQLVAGLAQHYAPETLVGREIVVVATLEPRMLKGVESQGMLLAADAPDGPVLLAPDRDVPPGSTVK